MTSPTPPADRSTLLVPVHVDALSVNSDSQQSFAISPPDYENLKMFESPIPYPFASLSPHESGQEAMRGIHLHWALPDALTHGKRRGNTDPVEFPYVPNRWLVVRFEASGAKWNCQKVTVIESDFIDKSDGTTNFLDPEKETKPDAIENTKIGRSCDIESWERRPDANGKLLLKAVGPGNVTFAAYQPFMQDVFAYTDLASDLPANGAHHYAYLVVGWYSDPAAGDPLRGVNDWMDTVWPKPSDWQGATPKERFTTLLTDLQWSINGDTPVDPPSTTLYHGYVYDVCWPNPQSADEKQPNVPNPENVRIAIGNTGADALAALIQHDSADTPDQETRDVLAQLLQAAQYDLLGEYGKPGGSACIEQKIRHAWFGDVPGGTIWEMVGDIPQSAGQDAVAVKLTPAQQASLDKQMGALNQSQRDLDHAVRELASLQSELYRYWWKNGIANSKSGEWPEKPYDPNDLEPLYPTGTTPQWTQEGSKQGLTWNYSSDSGLKDYFQNDLYPDLQKKVWQKLCEVQAAAKKLPDPANPSEANMWVNTEFQIADEANPIKTPAQLGLSLKASTAPRFNFPNDPVVLFAGLRRSQKHGEDGRYNNDGTLTCRLPGETINGIRVGTVNVTEADVGIDVNLNPLSNYKKIPAIPNLLIEAFFSDFNNASVIADAKRNLDDNDVKTAMTADGGWPNPNALGTAPVPFALIDWEQAWAPLFLEWEVRYFPTGRGAGKEHRFDIGDWRFDGEKYTWNGTGFDPNYSTTYSGRTFVTPQAPLHFKKKIEDYLKDHPKPSVQALVDKVSNWDVLSQSLGGFTDQLLSLMAEETFPPPAAGKLTCPPDGDLPDVGTLIGDNYHTLPVLSNRITNLGGTKDFYPVRGGFLTIKALRLIDTFGQVIDTVLPNTTQGFIPVRGHGLAPTKPIPGEPGAIQLPPRAAQAARLDFRFLSVDGSGKDIVVADDPNAVCGWLLPNHLDGGISVYDHSGMPLGEILPLVAGNQNWRPRPGPVGQGPEPPATPDDIDNQVLRSVVASIASQTAKVFGDFLRVIDETSWMIDPLGGRKDQMFSVLIGRPLAVVRARLELALDGIPARCQFWQNMAKGTGTYEGEPPRAKPPWQEVPDVGEIEQISFPLQLGNLHRRDDGLLGYYFCDSCENFYAPHLPSELESSDYIHQIGAKQGNFIDLAFNRKPKTVTMIMDPRGVVHAAAGILPTKSIALPTSAIEGFMKQLRINFRTGPLIADPDRLRVPRPAEAHGTWNWLQRKGTGDTWDTDAVVNATDDARLSNEPLQLREGWLQLVEGKENPEE